MKIPPNPMKLNLFSRQDLNLTLICNLWDIDQSIQRTYFNSSLQEKLNFLENGGGKSSLGSDTMLSRLEWNKFDSIIENSWAIKDFRHSMCESRSRLEIIPAFDFNIDRCLLLIYCHLEGVRGDWLLVGCHEGKTFDTWRVNNSVSCFVLGLICPKFRCREVLAWHSGACLGPGTPKPQRWCLTWISAVKSTMAMTQLSAPAMPGQRKTEAGVVRARERGVTVFLWKWMGHWGFRSSSFQSGTLKCGLNVACVICGIKSHLEGQLKWVWNKCWQLQTWSVDIFFSQCSCNWGKC